MLGHLGVRRADPDAKESVHHCAYPEYDDSLHDEALAREMDATLKIVSLALSARGLSGDDLIRSLECTREVLDNELLVDAGVNADAAETTANA